MNKQLFMKSEQELNELQDKLKELTGVPMKYNQLCDALKLPIKSGKAKTKQLGDLTTICNLDIQQSPTRYVITEVFDEVMPVFKQFMNQAETMQLQFECCLYRKFYENACNPVYLSNTELLVAFKEVNDNFAFSRSYENMQKVSQKTGVDYTYMPYITQRVYVFLRDWANRAVKKMVLRSAIEVQYAFRLYKTVYNDKGKEIHLKRNIPIGTEEHKQCMELYEKYVLLYMGENWNGNYIDNTVWNKFQKAINSEIKEKYAKKNEWEEMRRIRVYSPSTSERVKERLLEICQRLDGEAINEEAQKRILTKEHAGITYVKEGGKKQDSDVTIYQRKEFVETNINLHPKVSFRDILYSDEEKT